MKIVEPKLFLVASTKLSEGMTNYLREIGAIDKPGKSDWTTNAPSDGDELVEIAGRLCYRAFFPWDEEREECSNENVSKIRESNSDYVKNILKSGHGSVLEHINISIMMLNVSRVVTHEIVRHRAGCAFSQESMRYVRLTNMKIWLPHSIKENKDLVDLFLDTVTFLEGVQSRLVELTGINKLKDFGLKKHLTSMMRRLSPAGLATSILVTANVRSWRHILAMRGSPAAEEEMSVIIPQLLELLKTECPNAFADCRLTKENFIEMDYTKV